MDTAPALPSELWRLVACHLSTKDWARVSGTCRATAAVQPRDISLQDGDWEALPWLIRHWHSAESLSLEVHGQEWEETLANADLGAGPLQLQRLFLDCFRCEVPESLAELLSSLTSLQVLQLNSCSLVDLSALVSLKHLMLQHGSWEYCWWEYLPALPRLETLALCAFTVSDLVQQDVLDLRACPRLRSVFYDNSVLPAILVPEDCAVSLVEKAAVSSFRIVAAPCAACVSCTSIHMLTSRVHPPSMPVKFESEYSRLTVLRIGGSYFGSDSYLGNNRARPMKISAAMPCLEVLELYGEEVCVRISGEMQPREFSVTGTESVALSIDDVAGFSWRLEQLCYCSKGDDAGESILSELQSALDARNSGHRIVPLKVTGIPPDCSESPHDFAYRAGDALHLKSFEHLSAAGFVRNALRPVPDVSWCCLCEFSHHEYICCSRWLAATGIPELTSLHKLEVYSLED